MHRSRRNARKPTRTKGVTKAIDALCRLRATVQRADTAKQRELLAMCIEKIEVWSTRDGGKGSTYHLERGVVHLRPDMWLTEAEGDNLFGSTC